MPILDPTSGAVTYLISDLATEVILKVENRTSDLPRAYVWLSEALREMAGNQQLRDEFVELERTGPLFTLDSSTPTQEYDESLFLAAGDINDATLDIRLWIDPPTNSRWVKLDPANYQTADKSNVGPSRPTQWYRFGGFIGFIPIPDQPYQVQARYLVKHPINTTAIEQTQILLPSDWNDILILAAAERGFIELMEYEKASAIHTLIYGDPSDQSKPGLINTRKKKRTKEAFRQTMSLKPIKRRYSWGR